jgi:hypothetical protein
VPRGVASRALALGFECPVRGGAARTSVERGQLRYWQCGSCEYQTSLIAGTMFADTKLALRLWFLALQLLTQAKNNVWALELKRQLGVSYRSAWLKKHKICEVMRLREDARELAGRVEIDDAFLGGEMPGGKAGRGSQNRVPPVAAVQTTDDGRPMLACLRAQPHTEEQVGEFAAAHIAPSASVVSDGLRCFCATALLGPYHERHVTDGGSASAKLPQFRPSIPCWAISRPPGLVSTTPSTSPSTLTATSPSSSTASIAAST